MGPLVSEFSSSSSILCPLKRLISAYDSYSWERFELCTGRKDRYADSALVHRVS